MDQPMITNRTIAYRMDKHQLLNESELSRILPPSCCIFKFESSLINRTILYFHPESSVIGIGPFCLLSSSFYMTVFVSAYAQYMQLCLLHFFADSSEYRPFPKKIHKDSTKPVSSPHSKVSQMYFII